MVEFNARFGDPETQVVLDRLATPLGPLLHAAATGDLAAAAALEWRPGAAVVVVIAADGYPAAPVTGDTITIPSAERSMAPASGTDRRLPAARGHDAGRGRQPDSAGGRVLSAVGSRPGRGRGPGRGLRAGRHSPPARRLVPAGHRRTACDLKRG